MSKPLSCLLECPPQLFVTGQIVLTPGAIDLLARHHLSPWPFISRHVEGDWGQVCPEDAQANQDALQSGARILSSYALGADRQPERLWVLTEAVCDEHGNRASTCLLLPEEY